MPASRSSANCGPTISSRGSSSALTEAARGVRSGEYYATLVIPKEFSRDLMTVFTDDITEPKIIYYDNEKENAIAQRVTATGASTLQETIDETFTETVASVALGTTSSLTSFMSGEGILTYAQTLGSRLGEAVGEVGAAADQAQAYADLMSSTTSLVDATASILKEAGKAPDATAPLVSETRDGLTSAPGRAFRREHRSREGAHNCRRQLRRCGPRRR